MLHIRNLPYETTHEELVELATPFGSLVQSKLNVGPNRNQAFIEFPDQASAIAMCNYFNGSADPAKVRATAEHCRSWGVHGAEMGEKEEQWGGGGRQRMGEDGGRRQA